MSSNSSIPKTELKEKNNDVINSKDINCNVNKENNITPLSIKKNIESIIEHIAEQDHVTIEIEEAKQLVGQDFEKHIATLEKKMLNYAIKLEFEDAARIRDEINRLKAKQVGLPKKVLEFNQR